jgi:hypothetical protein
MQFNKHLNLEGLHSFLSPSKYHWVEYSPERLIEVYTNHKNTQLGVRLHAFAKEAIELGQPLSRSKRTLNLFVNDAIGFRMSPEVVLYYSYFSFGTADAISFRKNKLRIHDLKTGKSPGNFMQVQVYAALFCLEYQKQPDKIEIELRIYQNDLVDILIPESSAILSIMEKIREHSDRLTRLEEV